VENFTDFGHFPWVHPGLLGDPDRPVVVIGRNYNLDQPERVIQEFEDTIFGQDQWWWSRSGPSRCPSTWRPNCT
jgi:hypothetical protein